MIPRFERFWLTEIQRHHELQNGLPELQNDVVGQLSATDMAAKVHQRARLLAAGTPTITALKRWHQIRRFLMFVLALIATVAGVGVAQSAMAGTEPLSLLYLLILFLLPNTIMLVAWLVFSLSRQQSFGVGAVALLVARKMVRSAHLQQVLQAWLQLVQRHQLLGTFAAIASHGFWLVLQLASLLTLFVLLSTHEFSFVWSTTILSESQVAQQQALFAWLPEWLGLGGAPDAQAAQFSYSAGWWLLACLFVYGVLPRLLLFFGAIFWLYWRIARMQLDLQADGIVAVVQRIQAQQHPSRVVDADDQPEPPTNNHQFAGAGQGTLGFWLDHQAQKHLHLPAGAEDLGVVATSAQRRALLSQLEQHTYQSLFIGIDLKLTPDRSSQQLLAQLKPHTVTMTLFGAPANGRYQQQWQALAEQLGARYVELS